MLATAPRRRLVIARGRASPKGRSVAFRVTSAAVSYPVRPSQAEALQGRPAQGGCSRWDRPPGSLYECVALPLELPGRMYLRGSVADLLDR